MTAATEKVDSVAGITVPAFVERNRSYRSPIGFPGVAGITVPAFVERAKFFTRCYGMRYGVAGITVPAFVERSTSDHAQPCDA